MTQVPCLSCCPVSSDPVIVIVVRIGKERAKDTIVKIHAFLIIVFTHTSICVSRRTPAAVLAVICSPFPPPPLKTRLSGLQENGLSLDAPLVFPASFFSFSFWGNCRISRSSRKRHLRKKRASGKSLSLTGRERGTACEGKRSRRAKQEDDEASASHHPDEGTRDEARLRVRRT